MVFLNTLQIDCKQKSSRNLTPNKILYVLIFRFKTLKHFRFSDLSLSPCVDVQIRAEGSVERRHRFQGESAADSQR